MVHFPYADISLFNNTTHGTPDMQKLALMRCLLRWPVLTAFFLLERSKVNQGNRRKSESCRDQNVLLAVTCSVSETQKKQGSDLQVTVVQDSLFRICCRTMIVSAVLIHVLQCSSSGDFLPALFPAPHLGATYWRRTVFHQHGTSFPLHTENKPLPVYVHTYFCKLYCC